MPNGVVRRRWGSPFNRVASAGPMRLVIMGGSIVLIGAVVIGVSLISADAPLQSSATRPVNLNPLPGGPNSTPLQDRVALAEDQRQAERAAQGNRSYTPPLAASQRAQPVELVTPPVAPSAPPARAQPTPARAAVETPPAPARVTLAQQVTPAQAHSRPAPQTAAAADDPAFRTSVQKLLNGWGGRPPQTTVTLPPPAAPSSENRPAERPADPPAMARRLASEDPPPATAASSPAGRSEQGRVLIPAGRGVYAHTVLATNSEAGGPVVVQADSGPIAGARMIGTFTQAGMTNRLVVKITSLTYGGQTLPVDGLVVAPDTMETSVATSVDHRLAERVLLPAAAAFIEGLGEAIARANTTTVISPFGGGTLTSKLNTEQQLGIAAGAAGARIGEILDQSTPRSALVHLAKDAAVGVLFLSNVTLPN